MNVSLVYFCHLGLITFDKALDLIWYCLVSLGFFKIMLVINVGLEFELIILNSINRFGYLIAPGKVRLLHLDM